jgi:hypothetical protein
VPIGSVYLGGYRSTAPVHYWARIGRNVARQAAVAAANLAAERAYEADHAVVRRLVARDPDVWGGLTVRRYREMCRSAKIITWCGRAIYRYPTELEKTLASDRIGYQIRRWLPKSDNVRIAI